MKTDEVRGPGAGSTRPNAKPAGPGFDEALRGVERSKPVKPLEEASPPPLPPPNPPQNDEPLGP